MSLHRRLSIHELSSPNKNANDITENLSTLSFEHALSTQEKHYLALRTRYHAFTVSSCAHATFIVAALNELRQVLSQIRNPINQKTIKFLNQSAPRNPIKVGFIGCGRLGKQIVTSLLTFADIRPQEIIISTRRPHVLEHFQKAGLVCLHDNKEVVATSNIVFLCCLPSHVPSIAEEIAGYISADCLLYSFVTGLSISRLRQTLQHTNIAKMDFTWSLKNSTKLWCIGNDVVNSLKMPNIALLTCPLSPESKIGSPVWSSLKTFETVVYAALNMCPSLGVTVEETLELLNIVFLAKSNADKSSFSWKHFLDEESANFVEKGNLPVFDLFHIATQDTPFTTFLQSTTEGALHAMLIKKYLATFNTLQ